MISVSSRDRQAEQEAVIKFYQVQAASFCRKGKGNDNDTCTFTLHIASDMSQSFLVLLENLMSVSIGGGQGEQNAVRKSYQVQVASFGGDGNDTCTYHYHPTRVMMSLTRWHFYFSPKKRALLPLL